MTTPNYKPSRLARLFAIYVPHLADHIQRNPQAYAYQRDKAPEVAQRIFKLIDSAGIETTNAT